MSRKPNWKKRGLPRPITERDRAEEKKQRLLQAKLRFSPEYIRNAVYADPSLIRYL